MKVAVEIQPMLDEHMTGVGWYTDNLIRRIKNFANSDDSYYLLGMDYYGRSGRLKEYTDDNVKLKVNGIMHYGIYRRLWKLLPFLHYGSFFGVSADVWHFVNFVVPPRVKGRIINTVYDMVYKTYPETMEKANYDKLDKNLKDSCSRADAIITISENSKNEIIGYLNIPGDKIHIVTPGVDLSVYRPMSPDEYRPAAVKYGLPDNYLLYLGTIEPRKNITSIVQAFEQFAARDSEGYKLVIAGRKGWMFNEVFELVKKLGIEHKVIFPGYIPEEDKPYIYTGAAAFVFPSLYEGFGMPPLEAMACGVPVITSNTSSLPEVVGDSGILADPHDIDAISRAMHDLTSKPEYRKELAERSILRASIFSWDDSVMKLIDVYRNTFAKA